MKKLIALFKEEDGVTALEYTVLAALVRRLEADPKTGFRLWRKCRSCCAGFRCPARRTPARFAAPGRGSG